MTNREKMLAAGVGVLVAAWVGNWGWGKYSSALTAAEDRVIQANDELGATRLEKAKGEAALKQLMTWREQSLPKNIDVARSQYRAWLLAQLAEAKVQVDDVTPTNTGSANANYRTLPFTIDGEANLEAVVRFLWAFHTSDQLHKITMLQLTPMGAGKSLRVRLNVEAISLTDADRDAGLNPATSDRLKLADAAAYIDTIVGRNLFADYVPPPPPRPPRPPVVEREPPPPKPQFDDSKYAKVSAILGSGDTLQAWILVDTTGESLRLKVGDQFKVGQLEGTITDIQVDERQVIVHTSDDKTIAVKLGDALRDGTEVLAETEI